jgi:hypothetical protein
MTPVWFKGMHGDTVYKMRAMLWPISLFVSLTSFFSGNVAFGEGAATVGPYLVSVVGQKSQSENLSPELLALIDQLSAPKLLEVSAPNPCVEKSNATQTSNELVSVLDHGQMPGTLIFALSRGQRVEARALAAHSAPTNFSLPNFVSQEFTDFFSKTYAYQISQHKNPVAVVEFFGSLPKRRYKGIGTFTHLTRLRVPATTLANLGKLRLHASKVAEPFEVRFDFQKDIDPSNAKCPQAKAAIQNQIAANEQAAHNLAKLTNIPLNTIRARMKINQKTGDKKGADWWKDL